MLAYHLTPADISLCWLAFCVINAIFAPGTASETYLATAAPHCTVSGWTLTVQFDPGGLRVADDTAETTKGTTFASAYV